MYFILGAFIFPLSMEIYKNRSDNILLRSWEELEGFRVMIRGVLVNVIDLSMNFLRSVIGIVLDIFSLIAELLSDMAELLAELAESLLGWGEVTQRTQANRKSRW